MNSKSLNDNKNSLNDIKIAAQSFSSDSINTSSLTNKSNPTKKRDANNKKLRHRNNKNKDKTIIQDGASQNVSGTVESNKADLMTSNKQTSSNENNNVNIQSVIKKELDVNLNQKLHPVKEFVHTVAGGVSKEQFNKKTITNELKSFNKQPSISANNSNINNNNSSISNSNNQKSSSNTNQKLINEIVNDLNIKNSNKSVEPKQSNNSNSSNNNNNNNRSVTLNNKSVIVSILNSNLVESNDNCSIAQNNSNSSTINANINNKNNTNKLNSSQFGELELEFEKNYVFRIKKPSKQNDQAKYRCNICNYFCNTVDVVHKHITGAIHKNNLENIRLEMKIRELKMPSQPKIDYLSSYLVDFYLKTIISKDNLKKRYDIYHKFKSNFLAKFPDAIINIYGSTAHGICFNDSSCDVSIEYDNNSSQNDKSSQQILKDITELIQNEMSDIFLIKSIEKSNNKIMVKSKTDDNIIFNFTTGIFSSAYKTSFLLKSYIEIDERVKILALCLRYIAKIAQIDKVDLCTLPPHAYIIMTIYFLQKINPPVLPVLHEINNLKKLNLSTSPTKKSFTLTKSYSLNDQIEMSQNENSYENLGYDYDTIQNFGLFRKNLNAFVNDKNWKSTNTENVGQLWLKLLTFYSIDFGFKKFFISIRREKRISKSKVKMYSKKLAVEDPFSLKQSLSRNLLTETNKFIITTISKCCLYFVTKTDNHLIINSSIGNNTHENLNIVDNLIAETGIVDARKSNKQLDEDNENEFDETDEEEEDENNEEDIQTESPDDFENDIIYNDNFTYKAKTNDIIDETELIKMKNLNLLDQQEPYSIEVKSSLSIPIKHQHQNGFIDYDDLDEGLICDDIEDDVIMSASDDSSDKNILNDKYNIKSSNYLVIREKTKYHFYNDNLDGSINVIKDCLDDLIDQITDQVELIYDNMPNLNLEIYSESLALSDDKANKYLFKFTANSIGLTKGPPKICSVCNKEGHLQNECPQDRLPQLENLPLITETWKQVLDNVCLTIMDDNKQTTKEEADRNMLFDRIKNIVLSKFPNAKLSLFGSSNNGFAMKKSDLDICMTLKDYPDETKMSLNFKKIIRSIGALFRYEQDFDMIEERVSAKVPIVKFRHKKTMIEGDISLYNTLALHNTDLLRSYAQIDNRIKVLGHMVKHFAKVCRIGDASCGSLSSYAYIVMMIHYLMNTEPPVLPCLQKLNRDSLPKKETTVNIDGWDCWFNRDLKNISNLWPYYKQNSQSIGELWLGFLRYYTEKFDWDNNVVCIRQDTILTRKSKNWIKHRMAIEDPFELTHNLAAGVSPKMGLYILKSFAKARYLFGYVINDFVPNEIRFNIEYFFNPKSLVEGNPPMDRNCFSCFKIGHQTKDCHLNNRRKENLTTLEDFLINNSLQCFRCRGFGHKAKECKVALESKRQKTVSTSNMNEVPLKCFKCNQIGHFARDCREELLIKNSNFNNNKPNASNSNKFIIQQQSAPPVKIVTFVNTNAQTTTPILIQSGENYQLIVNKKSSDNNDNINNKLNTTSNNNNNNNKNTNQPQQPNKNQSSTSSVSFHQVLLPRQQSTSNQFQKTSNSSNNNHSNNTSNNNNNNNNSNNNNIMTSTTQHQYQSLDQLDNNQDSSIHNRIKNFSIINNDNNNNTYSYQTIQNSNFYQQPQQQYYHHSHHSHHHPHHHLTNGTNNINYLPHSHQHYHPHHSHSHHHHHHHHQYNSYLYSPHQLNSTSQQFYFFDSLQQSPTPTNSLTNSSSNNNSPTK